MIEVKGGTIEEKIIKQLQKSYPISIKDLEKKIHISRNRIIRVLQQLQVNGIVQLKHHHVKKQYTSSDEDSIMHG